MKERETQREGEGDVENKKLGVGTKERYSCHRFYTCHGVIT